jgi:hypothetical protein
MLRRVLRIVPPPLLPGEAEDDYNEVASRFLEIARPRDAIEEFLTRDCIDLTWEIFRLRRMKAALLRSSASNGVRIVLSTIGRIEPSLSTLLSGPDFAQEWAKGDASKRREFSEILKKAGLTMDDVMAEALAAQIDSFERFDRMLASAEARRNNALREIDRHRETLGAAARRAVEEVQDAEFQVVD